MKTSDNGINLIKRFEGYRDKAYKCPAGVPTIGYGHTQGVTKDMTCNEEQAVRWLKEDVAFAERTLDMMLPNLNQNQFDALVSLIFNIGSGNFSRSTLCKLAKNNPNDDRVAKEFLVWNKAKVNGVLTELDGLTRRRKAEMELYITK